MNLSTAIMGSQTLPLQKESNLNLVSTSGGPRENWGESNMADTSTRTDTSTDDTDDKSQRVKSLEYIIRLVLHDLFGEFLFFCFCFLFCLKLNVCKLPDINILI